MRKLKTFELNRLDIQTYRQAEKLPFALILDNVRSGNNVGSVFRTADGFRWAEVFLCGITATPPNKEIQKTALGASESVSWQYYPHTADAVAAARAAGYRIVAVEQAEGSTSLFDFDVDTEQKYAFVFGNEVDGVQQQVIDQADVCLEIPQYGTKHSFNVAVTAGIVCWEVVRKWTQNGGVPWL